MICSVQLLTPAEFPSHCSRQKNIYELATGNLGWLLVQQLYLRAKDALAESVEDKV